MEQQDEQKEKLQQEGDSGEAGSTPSENLQAAAEAVEEKLEEGKEELKKSNRKGKGFAGLRHHDRSGTNFIF